MAKLFAKKVLRYDGADRIHPRRPWAAGDAGADQYAAGGFRCRGGSAAVVASDPGGSLRLPLLHPGAGARAGACRPELAAVRFGSQGLLRLVARLPGVAALDRGGAWGGSAVGAVQPGLRDDAAEPQGADLRVR